MEPARMESATRNFSTADGQAASTADDLDQVKPAAARIGIVVVAYNAESTLASVLDRVPKDFRPRISEVFVCDDHSGDGTYEVGLRYKEDSADLPLTVIRHPQNLGYGGNQKAGYRMAIDADLDIVVLLHGDGQYAPECLPDIVAPLERGEADAVMGSRMMTKGTALKGGMPLYKYVGNRVLTHFENTVLGTKLSEFHSGYRAYSVKALKEIQFERNSDGFNFDTQIIIQLVDAGKRIVEVPIPTYYGDEICYVDGLKYAKDITADVVRYRFEKLGFDVGELGAVGDEYKLKQTDSSHTKILHWLEHRQPSNLLDLGCSSGLLSERIRALGYTVTGIDVLELEGVRQRVDHFIAANLDEGLPAETAEYGPYDAVVCGDILEHVRDPEAILRAIRSLLTAEGVLITSVPNFGHWYPRGRTALGRFDYDQRGLLDNGHVRFFMRRGLRRRLRDAGFSVVRQEATGLPLDVLAQHGGVARRVVRVIDRALISLWPTMFTYQFVWLSQVDSSVADESPAVNADK
jgi:glycosyltransferase involved in cell wall biosynthesis